MQMQPNPVRINYLVFIMKTLLKLVVQIVHQDNFSKGNIMFHHP
jgi:hypothetical protein